MASFQGTSAFAAVAKQMRRQFGSVGSAARHDVQIAAAADLFSDEESEHAAWLAHRKAEKKKARRKMGRTWEKKAEIRG